jgi:hypothetical protein
VGLSERDRADDRATPRRQPAEPAQFVSEAGGPVGVVLGLQRTIGNAAVGRLLRGVRVGARASPPTVPLLQRELTEKDAKTARRAAKEARETIINRYGHIRQRHGSASTATGAGKFGDDKAIFGWVQAALERGTPDWNVRNESFVFDLDLATPTGIYIDGRPTTGIRVIVTLAGKRPFVNTAFPMIF